MAGVCGARFMRVHSHALGLLKQNSQLLTVAVVVDPMLKPCAGRVDERTKEKMVRWLIYLFLRIFYLLGSPKCRPAVYLSYPCNGRPAPRACRAGAGLLPHAPTHRQAPGTAQLVSSAGDFGVAEQGCSIWPCLVAPLPSVWRHLGCMLKTGTQHVATLPPLSPQVRHLAGGAALRAAHGAPGSQLWRPAFHDAGGECAAQVGYGAEACCTGA